MGSEHTFEMVGKSRFDRRRKELATLAPREGHVLTGLVAEVIESPRPPFPEALLLLSSVLRAFSKLNRDNNVVALGILDALRDDAVQGVASEDATAQMVPLQRTLKPPPGDSKRCWTSATNLEDVTTIRFSKGMPHGGQRTDNHITGLMLHYRGSERVAIVGQWIKEVDAMTIDASDFITHIRVYYTRSSEDAGTWPGDYGKVSGVVVETARGATKTVWARKCEKTPYIDFRANRLEEMVSPPNRVTLFQLGTDNPRRTV